MGSRDGFPNDRTGVFRQTPRRPVVVFVVNGSPMSALGIRAQALAARLSDEYDIRLLYRSAHKLRSLVRFFLDLLRIRPRLSYVFDMSYSGVLAAVFYKILARNRLLIETGDVIYELAKSMGRRSWAGLWLTKQLEALSLKSADRMVVRGTRHKEWLDAQGIHPVDVIQDGVELDKFKPLDATALRRQYQLDGVLTVGLVGTPIWNERWDMGYGWELVEVLRLLKDAPVKGILIGDGSGISRLKARAREYGIEDKLLFLGHVPPDQLPLYLNLIDVCLSTQTNDLVGQVRTTGKLPLYLATGRYILASKVGEAALVLDDEMLVEYDGIKDACYPQRLADRIQVILNHRAELEKGWLHRRVAEERFDYNVLAEKLKPVMASLCQMPGKNLYQCRQDTKAPRKFEDGESGIEDRSDAS
ncbi:MAG: glycosyltransferase [Acidobacteria bacterium]|nr:glycosyltransferase [Acidobacteriota bacterium]